MSPWREHFAVLCKRLGYAELSRREGAELRDWLMPLAVVTNQPFPLMGLLLNEVRRRHLRARTERYASKARLGHAFWLAYENFCILSQPLTVGSHP
ncbi:hypothetical protein HNQ04_001212 [Deinococcus radiopugnans ATCC 19172]|uniref:Transposase n=1 Tax=Deinococcus radiopugnans ATCC 19172 TaxID=585398 RepID=A0ABR6NPL9_9DEIO|nr:hypothetical protein [Deinococcus radiopugnans ATCC 19172]